MVLHEIEAKTWLINDNKNETIIIALAECNGKNGIWTGVNIIVPKNKSPTLYSLLKVNINRLHNNTAEKNKTFIIYLFFDISEKLFVSFSK